MIWLLQVKTLLIFMLRTEKVFLHVSIIYQTQTSFCGAQNRVHQILYMKDERIESLYFPERKQMKRFYN